MLTIFISRTSRKQFAIDLPIADFACQRKLIVIQSEIALQLFQVHSIKPLPDNPPPQSLLAVFLRPKAFRVSFSILIVIMCVPLCALRRRPAWGFQSAFVSFIYSHKCYKYTPGNNFIKRFDICLCLWYPAIENLWRVVWKVESKWSKM